MPLGVGCNVPREQTTTSRSHISGAAKASPALGLISRFSSQVVILIKQRHFRTTREFGVPRHRRTIQHPTKIAKQSKRVWSDKEISCTRRNSGSLVALLARSGFVVRPEWRPFVAHASRALHAQERSDSCDFDIAAHAPGAIPSLDGVAAYVRELTGRPRCYRLSLDPASPPLARSQQADFSRTSFFLPRIRAITYNPTQVRCDGNHKKIGRARWHARQACKSINPSSLSALPT